MSKIEIPAVPSGFLSTTALNARFQQIEDALNNDVLYRNNPEGEDNKMSNLLDMSDNRIINLPDAVDDHEPVVLGQIDQVVSESIADLDVSLGNVVGPLSASTDKVALFDGITGRLLKVGSTIAEYFASPVFTGNPTAPTQAANNNSTRLATTAYVQTELLDRVQTVATFADLATTAPTVGATYSLKEFNAGTGKGGGELLAKSGVITPNNVTTFASATAGVYFERINYDFLTVEMGGARGDGTTNDLPAIQAMIDKFTGGQKILFPSAQYRITGTLYPKYQGIYLEGAGVYATELIYDAPGGTMIKANSGTTIINSAGISKMTLRGTSTTNSPDVVVDLSGFSYCTFRELELVTARTNGKIWSGYSDLGTAPYFNVIDDFTMFGGGDLTQTGFSFTAGAWGGGSRGANANIISNLKRAAALKTLIDIQDGQGNIFTNIVGESINTDFIKLNDVPSYADTGTITGFTQNTLTDTSKAWTISPDQIYVNYSVLITSGAGAGQCRSISSHTGNTLTLSAPWGISLQSGVSTYALVRFGAVDNIFSNVRQEGNGGNFVKCLPGAIGNRLTDAVVSGVTTVINDLSGDPTNHLSNGDLIMLHEVIRDIGPSANFDVWPRVSVLGGMPVGRNYSIEFLQVNCPGIVSGIATITLDAGGATVGGGSPSVSCVLDSVLTTGTLSSPVNKSAINSSNNNLFLNITTSAAMNPTTDFIIAIALRVH